MPELLFVVSGLNLLLFGALAVTAVKRTRLEMSPRMRSLGWVAAAAASAFVMGAAQRMMLQATRAGWIENRVSDFVLSEWQLVQSLLAMVLGGVALRAITRVWGPPGKG